MLAGAVTAYELARLAEAADGGSFRSRDQLDQWIRLATEEIQNHWTSDEEWLRSRGVTGDDAGQFVHLFYRVPTVQVPAYRRQIANEAELIDSEYWQEVFFDK